MVVIEWNLTTVWHQEAWLAKPPHTRGARGPTRA